MGAMGVIIPFVWTVARVFFDGQSAASRCYLQTADKGYGGADLGLISSNSGNTSERGPQICLGMGRTGSEVLRWGCSPGVA